MAKSITERLTYEQAQSFPVRLNAKLADAVHFANWCRNSGLEPADGAKIIALAKARHAASVLVCNGPGHDDAEQRAIDRLFAFAAGLGFGVDVSGTLWATLVRPNGDLVQIPDLG